MHMYYVAIQHLPGDRESIKLPVAMCGFNFYVTLLVYLPVEQNFCLIDHDFNRHIQFIIIEKIEKDNTEHHINFPKHMNVDGYYVSKAFSKID